MPQASDEARNRYRRAFGDIGPEHAMAVLTDRGFVLDKKEWFWTAPSNHEPSEEELDWIDFLADEWDFGGLKRA